MTSKNFHCGMVGGFLALALLSVSEGVTTKYNIYFGDNHTHTSYSDGFGRRDSSGAWPQIHPTPSDAFSQARNSRLADYMVVSDHAGWSPGIYFNLNAELWSSSRKMADRATKNGIFVAIVGPEYSPPSTYLEGHMNIFNLTPTREYYPNPLDRELFYDMIASSNIVAQWNHPSLQYVDGAFKLFAGWSPTRNHTITMIEICSAGNRAESAYQLALDRGWKVAPIAVSDTHTTNWIVGYEMRTAVLATKLTRSDIYDAWQNRRCYATENRNLRIGYEINGFVMGSTIPYADKYNAAIHVDDPDTDSSADRIGKIELVSNRGAIIASQEFSSHTVNWRQQIVSTGIPAYYFARVKNAGGQMAWTAPIWVPASKMTVMSVPAVTNQLNLAWADSMTEEDGYEIWKSAVTNSSYTLWKKVDANTTNYVDETLSAGTMYCYKVRPYVGTKNYPYSNEACATTTALETVAPSVPAGLALFSKSSNNVNIVFLPSTDDQFMMRYGMVRDGVDLPLGKFAGFSHVSVSGVELVKGVDIDYKSAGHTVAPNTTYNYEAYAIDWAGNRSALSEVFTVKTHPSSGPPIAGVPDAPMNLVATAVARNQINLVWTDCAYNETEFKIDRKREAGGTYLQIATLSPNMTNYSDIGLASGCKYYYRVSATNSIGVSEYSNEAHAVTPNMVHPQ